MKLDESKIREMIQLAYEAREYAYVPYSEFAVGAALLAADGRLYKGCNIENAAYGPTNCAERTAFFKAVSEGVTEFSAIAIVGGKKGTAGEICPPCGVCRQVMAEFCGPDDFLIILGAGDRYETYTLREMLPLGFTGANLKA